jgi:hypothetical protein
LVHELLYFETETKGKGDELIRDRCRDGKGKEEMQVVQRRKGVEIGK